MTEVLLQRTRAAAVASVYSEFRQRFGSPDALARCSEASLLKTVGRLGLHWRAGFLIRLARDVAARGQVPDDYDSLVALPGVGPYAASAYLSLHRNTRATIIDANVVRILGRMIGQAVDGETRRKPWVAEALRVLTPMRTFRDFNYALLDLGMLVCRRCPACHSCPLVAECRYARSLRAHTSETISNSR